MQFKWGLDLREAKTIFLLKIQDFAIVLSAHTCTTLLEDKIVQSAFCLDISPERG
jgi:hypothetical protein